MKVNERVKALQQQLVANNIDAYIIPSGDPHQSEYVPLCWRSREWISGFTGSAGTIVITPNHAGLWTDSRYFIQGAEQLKGTGIELHKLTVPHTPQHLDWMKEHLPKGAVIGFNGWMMAPAQVEQIKSTLSENEVDIKSNLDLIGNIWENRPSLPGKMVYEHEVSYAGKSRAEKIATVRQKIKEAGGNQYFLNTLDDIAWLLNLRGKDVDCNPVFISYVVVAEKEVFLFAEAKKFSKELKATLAKDDISILPYGRIAGYLNRLPKGEKILVDKGKISVHLFEKVSKKQLIPTHNIVEFLKTIKNETEINHFREVMIKDGVALTRLFRWLEFSLKKGTVGEVELAEKLKKIRKTMDGYVGESFDAIVGYKSNGAIVHYKPEPDTCAQIKNEGMLLLDCGGQYLDGTTDITRTVTFSKPTEQQILDFTLVLKGHIALAMAQFPKGTNGVQLDAMTRQHLWRYQRNYGHGTGHGVGFFLNVHEGPQRISPNIETNSKLPFEVGMVTSNEPGIYRSNQYGIRIENLILCTEAGKNEFGEFLQFETITLFPIDLKLIDASLLSKDEKDWLNNYHQTVFERLSPNLKPAEVKWLRKKCKAVK